MKILAIGVIAFTFLLIVGLLSAIVPEATEENTITVSTRISAVRANSSQDIQFRSEWGGDTIYYINRGEELGLDAEDLNSYVQGKLVSLSYVHHRSPLDWNNQTRHLVRVSCGDSIIFVQ